MLFSYGKQPFSITVNLFGYQRFSPKSTWGPGVQNHHVLHFIRSGKGTLRIDGVEHRLGANDMFVLFPGVPVQYTADPEDPWEYYWLGVSGLGVPAFLENCDLCLATPHMTLPPEQAGAVFESLRLIRCVNGQPDNDLDKLRSLSLAYYILSKLAARQDPSATSSQAFKKQYVDQAVEYIKSNFNRQFSIETLSKHLNLNRNYLTRVFKEQTGKSPHQYLNDYRLERAVQMLKDSSFSIEIISSSIGFDNPCYFSRVFKQYTGYPPAAYRKQFAHDEHAKLMDDIHE